ncbi:MAG: hypothetical protein QM820_33055 [Minicystis sp.]
MRRIEIDALVRAHRGRAHPVAFFHVLRQTSLDEDDQIFLGEHADVLTVHDLLAWRSRCAPGFTGAVIRRLAQIAVDDPGRFDHEILRAPRVSLAEEEWIEIASLVRGKVPDDLDARLTARVKEPSTREPEAARATSTPRNTGLIEPVVAEADPVDFSALLAEALDDPGTPVEPPAPPVSAEEAPEAILERARQAFSAEERAVLLDWLSRHGFARRPLIETALGAVRAGSIDPMLISWLAGQLGTRSAWEAHGVDLFLAFTDPGAFAELEDLLAQTWSHATRGSQDDGAGSRRLLDAMHATFGAALIQSAREGLAAADEARALTALSALACLDPPPRLSRSIHDLLRAEHVTREVQALIELNVRLVKHAGTRDASFAGVIAAVQGMADARLGS